MKVRRLLILTAVVSSILGALAAYLALTVPNDLKADAMLRRARQDVASGKRETAREELAQIVQHYPRTDAAAAATVALVKLAAEERKELSRAIDAVRKESTRHAEALSALQKMVALLATPPPPPAAATSPKKVPAVRKAAPKRRTAARSRRRR